MAALKAAIDSAAARCRCASIRLDGGDEMQGTLESNLVYGQSVVRGFNLIGLDAGAVGNHELDWGIDTLLARQADAHYPWLAANVFFRGTTRRPAWARPYAIIQKGGARIGVVGYLTSTMPSLVRATIAAPYEFRNGLAGIADALDSVRAKSPDFIVIVAHAGGGCSEAGCRGEMVDLANQLDSAGVDLIIGGHEHTATSGVVHGIPIVRASSQGRAISVVDLYRTRDGAHHFTLARDTVYDDAITPDAEMLALMRPYLARVDSIGRVPVAALRDSLIKGRGVLGVAISDAMRQAVSADVGLVNSGGVRAPLAAGAVTYDDVFRVLPFGNTVVRLRMTARQLRDALEPALAKTQYFFGGIRVRFDSSAAPGRRVTLTRDDGRMIRDEEILTVALPDFVADGGDYFAKPAGVAIERSDIPMLDAFIAMLKRTAPPVR